MIPAQSNHPHVIPATTEICAAVMDGRRGPADHAAQGSEDAICSFSRVVADPRFPLPRSRFGQA